MTLSLHARKNHLELAEMIVEIIRKNGFLRDARLPEQQLADLCGVSRTPVRAALGILEARGIVAKTGGGYRLTANPNAALPAFGTPSDAEDRLGALVLRDRAARRLDPSVTVAALARRYDADRRTVQKSLERLAVDGVIERGPGQAWHFRSPPNDADALIESYDFRLLTEPAVIATPGFALDDAAGTGLRGDHEMLLSLPDACFDRETFHRLDVDFHLAIAGGCPNRFLGEAVTQHLRLRRHASAAPTASLYRLRQSAQEHLAILDALESGQTETAADLMRVHLRASRNQRPSAAGRGAPALRNLPGGGRT